MSPTFVIAGGQRCGTTTLYHLLDDHPDVYMAKPPRPEPKYFLEDPQPGRDRDWYVTTWFSSAGQARAAGEKSTSYLDHAGSALRMRRQFPHLRVVFCLRHPFERAISNYVFSREHGLETLSCDEAILREEERVHSTEFPDVSAHPFAYTWRGCYADRLAPFRAAFPETQIRVVLFEDLVSNPRETLPSLYEFIGVDPTHVPPGGIPRHNATVATDVRISRRALALMSDRFRDSNDRLGAFLGRDLTSWSEPTPRLLASVSPP